MTNKNDDISKKIKYFRKLRGMTQEELSVASGIDYSQIRRYETGARNPKFDQLQSIARARIIILLIIITPNQNCVPPPTKASTIRSTIPKSNNVNFAASKAAFSNQRPTMPSPFTNHKKPFPIVLIM